MTAATPLGGSAPERPAASTAASPTATVPELIARNAEEHPHALAVTDGSTSLTYRELVDAASRLAAELAHRGVRPGSAVGLLCARSTRLVVAELAVWWAGGQVVPLDPAYPRPRIAEMTGDAGVRLTLGDKALLADAGLADDRVLVLTETGPSETGPAAGSPAAGPADRPAATPEAVALVHYTSGSTGRPKGVQVPHAAVADLATAPDSVMLGPGDRMLFHSPATFDAATFELWAPLARGAAVAVSPAERPTAEELARDVERFGVTTAFLTTALFHQLAARRSRIFGVLRTVVAGGEALAAEHAGAVLRAFPWLTLVNGYGPTEATTFATLHRVEPADCTGPVPIGRPFGGARTYVLDDGQAPVPDGTRGELWIAGTRLAVGYLGRPELTDERFRDLPGIGRAYRTGDLAVRRPDGTLEFHGRLDDQVKVRGFRIEPGEIEHALRAFPEVAEAAVVVRRAGREDAALTACLVPAEGTRPAPEALRRRLAERLPAHLVPTAWTVLDALPLTGTGKVDRRALAEDDTAPAPVREAEPATAATPLTPIQQVVAEAWSRALERPVTAPDADFFAEGGHSLLAMWVVDDLREDLGVELPLGDFLDHPTVAGQAALIERALLAADDAAADDAAPDDAAPDDTGAGAPAPAAHLLEPTR
ncbi:non-ribosomal peptide synthetase [Kitasatospora sp. A2-31]|uniref:non-ribosomal peptide synthetase n=1 Tax=Kitasatospora sp. A2-31 TaxID=2916414 RepID=UPI001EEB5DC7|nr:non-ribosomal peptide synthetase [Kitasatospora sp. A2-31]MCG6498104.1 non-ribosomal peptide synthetase [Kitasatospora sp. A2-31]